MSEKPEDTEAEVRRPGGGCWGARGVHRMVFMASVALLGLSLGHFVYHYVLLTEVGYRFMGYAGLR